MNERIRECWLKAAREDSSEKWDTQEELIERFAGFIVQQCAKLADKESCYPYSTYGLLIREQFGVKE